MMPRKSRAPARSRRMRRHVEAPPPADGTADEPAGQPVIAEMAGTAAAAAAWTLLRRPVELSARCHADALGAELGRCVRRRASAAGQRRGSRMAPPRSGGPPHRVGRLISGIAASGTVSPP